MKVLTYLTAAPVRLLLFLLLLKAPAVSCQQDDCTVTPNDISSSLPSYNRAGSITSSTGSVAGITNLGCGVNDPNIPGVWYQLTLPAGNDNDAVVVATVSNQQFSAGLALFSGDICGTSPSCLGQISPSAYTDRRLEWAARAGTTYYLLVKGSSTTSSGSFQLSVQALESENDACGKATDVTTNLPLSFAVAASNTAAVPGFADLSCSITDDDRGLWYRLTPNQNSVGTATISNQAFSARLSLYSGANCDSLTCLGSTSASEYTSRSLSWKAEAGTTYYVLASGNTFSDDGQFQISIQAPTPSANDECSDATDVSSVLPYAVAESNALAFPNFASLGCNVDDMDRGLWYQLTPVQDVVATATASNQAFSARISLYSGSCGSLTCKYTSSASEYSNRVVQWAAAAGSTYYVLVTGNTFADAGQFRIAIEAPSPPPNYQCSGATDISSILPYLVADTTTQAFPGFSDLACNIDNSDRGMWYKLTPTENTIITATISNQAFSARISLYSGSCGSLTCEYTSSASEYSNRVVQWAARAGATYYLLVSGSTFVEAGQFRISVQPLDPLVHDGCNGAKDVTLLLPYSAAESNAASFPGFSDLPCSIDSSDRGLWYRLALPETAPGTQVTVSNQEFAARISLYTGNCGILTCVQTTSTSSYSVRSITWTASAGTTYYILVSGSDFSASGQFQISIQTSIVVPPNAPVVPPPPTPQPVPAPVNLPTAAQPQIAPSPATPTGVRASLGDEDDGGGGSSTGLYGLASLALIPLVVLAVIFRKRLGCRSGEDKRTPTMDVGQSLNSNRPPANDAVEHQEVAVHCQQPPQHGRAAVAQLQNKDQARTHIQERQIAAAAASPPGPAMAQGVPRDMTANPGRGYFPENKDQCRSVAMPRSDDAPPMVSAVIVEPDQQTISSSGKTRARPDP